MSIFSSATARMILWDLFIFLPAFAANSAPVIAAVIPKLDHWNQPVWAAGLGKNKTWRGLISAMLAGTATGMLQYFLSYSADICGAIQCFNLPTFALCGFLIGTGAIAGDMAKSWFKRKIGIAPGKAFPIADGVDYILGAIIFAWPLYAVSVTGAVALLFLGPIASLCANVVAYGLGWKKQWY